MRRVCTHHKKTPLVVQNVGFRLGVLGTVGNIIPVPPRTSGGQRSKSMLRSKHLARTLSHKWLETGGGGLSKSIEIYN
jgi:hypothetical protein